MLYSRSDTRAGVSPLRRPRVPRDLHPPDLGRADHAATGMQALREASDNVGEAELVMHVLVCPRLDQTGHRT